ncbi:glycosyltransferase family 117 protein [Flaviaesturariibacter aridisoli]|uniref:DUF2723 domain-containing protein n=1 Tax=Flaviaesturariibacter aridisoli TaxID=2545761 RepID=A0A4R4DWZ4_9BACT|nr:DUF2723 domain-containing protein [Flaviaesturariibacter aridisoli]TCZ69098.1 DUF2723 domain-containing protein [Flaviaesturariibacter aridisoli]
MNFKRVNNLTGWVVGIIACLVYVLTAEKSGSFWDCGEFVSTAYKLQLPHPPGAPVFTLLGRFFIILFGDNPATAAKAVNIMNALASGLTILFLFWTITHFARKLMVGYVAEPDRMQTLTIMGAGIVGGLAYTFTDSFWFSAVEGEVYALSSFFTALIFWAMLKWERADVEAGTDRQERAYADRWIVFIAFMTGLAIGVHLLGLLTIPAIVMIYYYRRYEYTQRGAIIAFIIGCAITGVVQVAAIQWTVKIAGKFDIFFVNNFGAPFFSGFIFFFLLLAAGVWYGLRAARRNGWSFLRLGLWSFIFMMLGYSLYGTTMIRSNANPAIDMNNVDNPMSLVSYLGRDQYGAAPLLYGPHFAASPKIDESGQQYEMKETNMRYSRNDKRYIELGYNREYVYEGKDQMLFPRIWDSGNEQGHADAYASWLNIGRAQGQNGQPDGYDTPSYGDNINWFITYQMGHMYWRYFMWNFAGRQNDIQGDGNKRDGNWISGIGLIDNTRLGDQSKLPDSIRHNKATNKLYLLPFILGIFGCVYHFMRDRKDWIVSFLLFFFTGIAIVLYLNQPGNQPRERDYAYAGSFYAYCIWIGLAVVGFVGLARERADKSLLSNSLIYGSLATFTITLMSNTTTSFGPAIGTALVAALIYAALVGLVYFVVRAASGNGSRLAPAAALATLLCLSAPIVMGMQEWDDHDRSRKTLAPDVARDYLESCAPNAILFTFGDNDTYPLWYAQETEGVRPDIRIINTSLLGIDWYVNQLRYKVNQSAPIDVIWTPEQITGLGYIQLRPGGGPTDLLRAMRDDVGRQITGDDRSAVQATLTGRSFTVPVDMARVRANKVVNDSDVVLPQLQFDISEGKRILTLDQLTILNVIAANAAKGWERPIYFTSPYGDLGFGQFLRKDGMTYRLVPVQNSFPQRNWIVDQAMRGSSIRDNNTKWMYDVLMQKFRSGGANLGGVYFDEENRRHLLTVRSTFAEAAGNMADKGDKARAVQLLDRSESLISPNDMPYAMVGRFNAHNQTAFIYLEAAYKAGHTALAKRLHDAIVKDLTEQKAYYDYLKTEKEAFYQSLAREDDINNFLLTQLLPALDRQYNPATQATEHVPAAAADSTNRKH